MLGTPVLHGRDVPSRRNIDKGGPRVVILSHALWTSRFSGDPSIVGKGLRLDVGDAYTVVGVMPPGLELRLFNDRDRRPEPLIWLPKQGFEDFEPNLRGAGILERHRPASTWRLGR